MTTRPIGPRPIRAGIAVPVPRSGAAFRRIEAVGTRPAGAIHGGIGP